MNELIIKTKKDYRGLLGYLELPFVSKRWAITSELAPNSTRGGHALKYTTEMIFLLSGSCRLTVSNGSDLFRSIDLRQIDKGILIEPRIYRTLSMFSSNCVLLHCYDRTFDPKEYIYNENELIDQHV